MGQDHQIAVAVAQAAMEECLSEFGGTASDHIRETASACLRFAGVPIEYSWNELPGGAPMDAVAVLEDGAVLTIDLGRRAVAVLET